MTATEYTSSGNSHRLRAAAGFSLIELAIVIGLITLLLGSLLVPLQSQIESRKLTDTEKILDNAREALLGYAAANGYFPCPADYAGSSAGAEATHTIATGVCAASVVGGPVGTPTGVYVGYLPAVTLGFTPTDTNGYAVDAYGNAGTLSRIRYAVSAEFVNGISYPFTRTNGTRSAIMSNILLCVSGAASGICALPTAGTTASNGLLFVCNTATGASTAAGCAAGATLTYNAIAVIWSLGANAGTTGGTSTHEAQNAEALTSADRIFVYRDKSNVSATEFDDVITWISPPMLFSRLLAAGQLP